VTSQGIRTRILNRSSLIQKSIKEKNHFKTINIYYILILELVRYFYKLYNIIDYYFLIMVLITFLSFFEIKKLFYNLINILYDFETFNLYDSR
jgi:hypothetical protein